MAKKKQSGLEPSGLPGFPNRMFSSLLGSENSSTSGTEDPLNLESFERVWRRRIQERKMAERVKQLTDKVERMERQEAEKKRAARLDRKCQLWHIVHRCKKEFPASRSDLAHVARYADAKLEQKKMTPVDAGPKTWRNLPGFPRLLSDALRHDRYKLHVRRFFSKVPAS